ncbi:MAG TPA: hypothetical protein PKJ41_04205 [Bryobacteraceae bacterium]|nr:hypothetical protein [Bryobacteraceae bacterium]HPT27570.1 hypothetical protein [Bryobacteraceae bacterium]
MAQSYVMTLYGIGMEPGFLLALTKIGARDLIALIQTMEPARMD